MFGESFEEREGILPGYGGHGDDHARLSGRASQIKVRTPKGKGNPGDRLKGFYHIISRQVQTQLKSWGTLHFPLIGKTISL